MGQPITVAEKRSANRGVLRFETNRPLSGMSHERYVAGEPVEGDRPVDNVARALFAVGGVDAVHINLATVTVSLSPGTTGEGLKEAIENLFRFYPDADEAGADEAGGEDPDEAAAAEAPAPEAAAPAEGAEAPESPEDDASA